MVLESTYTRESEHSLVTRVFVLFAGLLAAAGLVLAQLFLLRRTRRTLHPLLALATLATLGLTFYAFTDLGIEEHHLRVAKEDAFTSVHAL